MGDPGTPYWDPLLPDTEYTLRVYTVLEDDQGEEQLVERAAGSFTTVASEAVVVAPRLVTLPEIAGTARIGSTLTSSAGEWDAVAGAPGEVSYAYRWLRDGIPIVGADGASHRVGLADHGTALSVEITATKTAESGSASAFARSADVAVKPPSVVVGSPDPLIGSRDTPITVTVRVRPLGSAVTPLGEVSVTVAGQTHTAMLVDGGAVVEIGTLPRGTHSIRLSYAGSATVAASTGRGGPVIVL
ncbi:Ig-like domain-containing protein [Salana multivorans]